MSEQNLIEITNNKEFMDRVLKKSAEMQEETLKKSEENKNMYNEYICEYVACRCPKCHEVISLKIYASQPILKAEIANTL